MVFGLFGLFGLFALLALLALCGHTHGRRFRAGRESRASKPKTKETPGLRLFLPARAVFSTSFSNFHHRGFNTTPTLHLRLDRFIRPDWTGLLQVGATFTDRPLSAYFYDVAPVFARPDRPSYDAHAGYLGMDLFTGIAAPYKRLMRLFGGVQYYPTLCQCRRSSSSSPFHVLTLRYTPGITNVEVFYDNHCFSSSG